VQTRVLIGHIVQRPLIGSGFGAIAADYPYGDIPIYEISYLVVAFKTGLLGAGLFLSFLLRLLVDGVRGRLGALEPAHGVGRRALAVPVAIIGTVLAASATDPYLLAAYGLTPILAAIAWLDPMPERTAASLRSAVIG
jgi:hypothetical protein